MSSRKLVLFDIDGTLMRGAGPHHKEALIAGARSVLGLECTLEGIDTAGRMDRDLLTLMLKNAGAATRAIRPNLRRVMEESQQHYTLKCPADLTDKVCPGVRDFLELLKSRDIPMGIVTGNLSAIAWRKLELARLDRYFSVSASAEEGSTRARLAQVAAWRAKRKELAAKKCSVTLIGDHANDIAAAQANGFRSVAVATGMMQPDELRRFKPDLVLRTLEGASVEAVCGH